MCVCAWWGEGVGPVVVAGRGAAPPFPVVGGWGEEEGALVLVCVLVLVLVVVVWCGLPPPPFMFVAGTGAADATAA